MSVLSWASPSLSRSRSGIFVLLAAVVLLWFPTVMRFRVWRAVLRLPQLLVFAGVAVFIWLAENIATFCHVWIYPNQKTGWSMVSLGKFSSWYLLMIISFVLVNLVHRPKELSDA